VPAEAVAAVAPPDAEQTLDPSLAGVGGWLGLFALGCVVSPLWSFYTLFTEWSLTRTPDWGRATSSFPGLSFTVGFELLGGLLVAVALLALFAALMRTHPDTASIAVVVLTFTLVYEAGQLALLYSVYSGSVYRGGLSDELSKSSASLLRSIVWALIWLWYFFRSKRVRATFGPVSWSGAARWANRAFRRSRGSQ
jgi:hypothetical protein